MIKKILKQILPISIINSLREIKNKINPPRYFITGLNSGYKNLKHKALLYYITTPFFNQKKIASYAHTNLWEVTEIVSILNKMGFEVDVIDRNAEDFIPENKYDLFIGLSSGYSGKFFAKYAEAMPDAIIIPYVTGPEPAFSNKNVYARYDEFKERTGVNATPMRVYPNINFDEFADYADYLFCIGEKNLFSFNSYKKYGKALYSIMPGTSPNINFNPNWLKTRKRNHFLCFAGNGFICKGVDLIVEAFAKMPDCYVTICGPDNEKAFFDVYGDILKTRPNINYNGFLNVAGEDFQAVCSECSFIIFHSSSEGCCTSVATGMRAGLVPIVSNGTSVSVGDFGFLMSDENDKIGDIVNTVQAAVNLSDEEYSKRVYLTLKDAFKYTQGFFTKTFSDALLDVMQQEERFN